MAELAIKRLMATELNDESFPARVTAAKELIEHHVFEAAVPKGFSKTSAESIGALAGCLLSKVANGATAALFDSYEKAPPRPLRWTSAFVNRRIVEPQTAWRVEPT